MRVVFLGSGAIGLPTLQFLEQSPEHDLVAVVTQPDKPSGRDQRISPPPIKTALGQKVPVLQPAKIKAAIAQIADFNPDVLVVMAYGQILPAAMLEIPRIASLNLHASILPRWRGAAPVQAAVAAGDAESGVTVMYMDAGLDTGDILLQRFIPIAANETGGSLHDRLGQLAPMALSDALSALAQGSAPRRRQDSSLATYAGKLEREDGALSWAESAEVIERRIRAFDPWPGAFIRIASKERTPALLKIFRARVLPESGRPGSVLQVDGEIVIAAGEGALALEEVQLAGKRRMSAAEFARGFPGPIRVLV